MLGGERTEQSYAYHTCLFAFGVEVINGLTQSLRNAAHGYHNAVSIRCAVIVEQMIFATRDGRYLIHVALHNLGHFLVI